MELTFASLMARAADEPDAMYGLAARAVRISADGLTYRFLHAAGGASSTTAARSPRTTSPSRSTSLKEKGHPIITSNCCAISPAPRRPTTPPWSCASRRSARRDVPLFVAGAADLLARLLRASSRSTKRRSTSPLGCGPYKVGRFEAGRYIEYERVKDWWGADLPVARGQNNFDVVRYEFYRDRDVAFEGFTGKSYLFREEFTSRIWATRYDFPGDQGRPRQARRACPTTRRRARRAGSSTRGATSSRIRGCARR